MEGKTHLIVGSACGIVLAASMPVSLPERGIIVAGSVLGSLLCDIDNYNSKISRKFCITAALVCTCQRIIRFMTILLPRKQKRYVRSLIGHRGIMHSITAIVGLPCLLFFLLHYTKYEMYAKAGAIGLGLGLFTHVLLDMFSNGCPIFLPISARRVTPGRIKSGGFTEKVFRAVFIIMAIIIPIGKYLYERLISVSI